MVCTIRTSISGLLCPRVIWYMDPTSIDIFVEIIKYAQSSTFWQTTLTAASRCLISIFGNLGSILSKRYLMHDPYFQGYTGTCVRKCMIFYCLAAYLNCCVLVVGFHLRVLLPEMLVQVAPYHNYCIQKVDSLFWQRGVCIIATMTGCVHTPGHFRFSPTPTL